MLQLAPPNRAPYQPNAQTTSNQFSHSSGYREAVLGAEVRKKVAFCASNQQALSFPAFLTDLQPR
jgi:hypothetical protein